MQEIPAIVPCDDCGQPCSIFICTSCYEKSKISAGMIAGLKKAIKILDNRETTAKAFIYDEVYLAAFKDLRIFFNAELFRQEYPEQTSHTTTAEFK